MAMALRGLVALVLAVHSAAVAAGAPTVCSTVLGDGRCGLVGGSNYTCTAGFWCSRWWFCGPAATHKMVDWETRADYSDDAGGACSAGSGATRAPSGTTSKGPEPSTITSKSPEGEGEALRSLLIPATMAALVLAGVALAANLAWQVHMWRKQARAVGPASDLEQPPVQAEGIPAANPQLNVKPSMWCVTPKQFFDFIEEVHQRYPHEDPNAHKVVEEMIKPRTRDAMVSYALLQNPHGLPVKHFVTHAWDEGVKSFGAALRRLDLTGGLWICFLATPQTWPRERLYNLLTPIWSSAFASALHEATDVIAVRNSDVNMDMRFWCVHELVTTNKPLVVVVPPPDEAALTGAGVGFGAACLGGRGQTALRLAMCKPVAEVNCVVGTVVQRLPML